MLHQNGHPEKIEKLKVWKEKSILQIVKKKQLDKCFETLTIVNSPEHNDEIKSLPARDVTIVLWAPETAESESEYHCYRSFLSSKW